MARNRKRNRNRSKTKSKEIIVIILLCFVLSLIAFGVMFLWKNKETHVDINISDLCPVDGPRATYAILLDTTDEISQITKQDIQKRANEVLKELESYYKISLYIMDDQGLNKEPVATLCRPIELGDMGELAQKGITANPEMIKEKYHKFTKIMDNAIDQMLDQKFEGAQSPLMSSLQNLSLKLSTPTTFDNIKYPAGKNKIIFVTDMLEYTPTFSMYNKNADFELYEQSRASEKFGKNYDEDIEFWQIRRNNSGLPYVKLQNLWAKILRDLGDPNLTVIPLIGEK